MAPLCKTSKPGERHWNAHCQQLARCVSTSVRPALRRRYKISCCPGGGGLWGVRCSRGWNKGSAPETWVRRACARDGICERFLDHKTAQTGEQGGASAHTLSGARAPACVPRCAAAIKSYVALEGGVSGEVGARGGGEKEARQKYGYDARAPVMTFANGFLTKKQHRQVNKGGHQHTP